MVKPSAVKSRPISKKPRSRPRKRREDSFFGLHFDLHANDTDTNLGLHVTDAMVKKIIRAARPDFIQYDCKGHGGFLAYPNSNVSKTAGGDGGKGIVRDSIAIYRKATAAAGVALYMHFSGVWDNQALIDNPEWATIDPGGKPRLQSKEFVTGATSTFSPYVTQRMIPQLKEVVERYGVDGFWVDGECWALQVDYCEAAVKKFREQTGPPEVKPPTKPGEPLWVEWMTIQREQFFAFLRTYMNAMHEAFPGVPGIPGVQIASNWLYTPIAPAPLTQPVDFISGDYSSHDSVNSARFNARYMSSVGLPWDLMAWSFGWYSGKHGHVEKTAAQLQQEAAAVIALGGGFQFYFNPDRHGGFGAQQIKLMKDVADFCHPRKEVCFKSDTVPQVAVLLDTNSLFAVSPAVFAAGWAGEYGAIQGMLEGVLESGHAADVVADHQLHGSFDRWPVIVVPEWEQLASGMVDELIEYARRGGSLFVTGAKTARLFEGHLGVTFDGDPAEEDAVIWVGDHMARVKGLWQKVKPIKGKAGAKVLFTRTPGFKEDVDAQPAVTLAALGKGKIAVAFGPLGKAHGSLHTPAGRDLIGAVLDRLYKPVARLADDTPRIVDLIVRRRNGSTIVHLNNVTGMTTANNAQHDRYFFTDYVPPTPPLKLTVRLDARPRCVRLEPGGKRLNGTWSKGELTVKVPPVHVHSAVVFE